MNVFLFQARLVLFQARLDRYDLRSELTPRRKEPWQASRYRHAMRGRDIVYLWRAGSEDVRGIYGWGRLEGGPKLKAVIPSWTCASRSC